MRKHLLYLFILHLGLSCNISRQENRSEPINVDSAKTQAKVKENIRFGFSAKRINLFQDAIEIKASLFNDNPDTVYFLSSSCSGEQSSLRYDTAKFALTTLVNCNASYPMLIKIAPKGQYDFQAYFRSGSDQGKIKLGFDFFPVDRSFDLNKIDLAGIHGRQEQEQTIIWATEQVIN